MRGKRLTTEEFIKKAKEIHDNKYDYSLADYSGSFKKVKIVCSLHGVFEQAPNNHLNLKQGCPICGKKDSSNAHVKTTEEFIKKAKEIHGDKYDYSLVDYKNAHTKIKIICPKHGIFEQLPLNHLSGKKCPKCKGYYKTTEEFIKEAREIHGNKYDYSLVDYKNSREKIKIICPKHGVFEQTPHNHLCGSGCPKCSSSHGENEIRKILEEYNFLFEEQKRFKELGRLSFDFYLPKQNTLIEYQGEQHYKESCFKGHKHDLKKQQERDNIKREFAKKHNYNLIEIPYNVNILIKLKEEICLSLKV